MSGEEVLIPLSVFATGGWIVWTIATNIRRTRIARLAAETHARVLDRCAGSSEMITYLESSVARGFLDSAVMDGPNPAGRILNAFQAGSILSLIGFAAFLLRLDSFEHDGDRFLLVVAAMSLAVGLGFLISAAASWVLCRSWGLLAPTELRSNRA
ncbi:MAG: hypothetical protein JO061_16965 [Acidobacteriaceae bacterium]|nr:hypothetical protein [Acidobacteriaceae bacterium]